jgi:hypothetical protein
MRTKKMTILGDIFFFFSSFAFSFFLFASTHPLCHNVFGRDAQRWHKASVSITAADKRSKLCR